jgi:hypothetical protein
MASSEHTAYFILNNGCILYLYHVSERSNAFLSLFSAVLSAHIKQLLVDFQLLCVYQRTLLGLSDSDVHAHIYGILQNQLLRHLRLRPTLKSYFCLLLVSGDAYESLSGILPRDLSLLSLPTRYCLKVVFHLILVFDNMPLYGAGESFDETLIFGSTTIIVIYATFGFALL